MLEHNNCRIYSEATYLQKSLKAADTTKFRYFCQKHFCCIKFYTPPVLLIFSNLKLFSYMFYSEVMVGFI